MATTELGTVTWHKAKEFDDVKSEAERTGKPIFMLFQEIPGCSTCTSFGKNILSNDKIVKSIENDFIPIVVQNNKLIGSNHKLLKKYKEPSWNNPVVRFLDSNGKDIIDRKGGVYGASEMATRMQEALKKHNK
mmetsp:Transcript_28630/g.31797  ORF Transcript_28630/g.31797 Transcript_28630/m.31797 type:complete len:133 (+) Transcript_28630:74-472(+)